MIYFFLVNIGNIFIELFLAFLIQTSYFYTYQILFKFPESEINRKKQTCIQDRKRCVVISVLIACIIVIIAIGVFLGVYFGGKLPSNKLTTK